MIRRYDMSRSDNFLVCATIEFMCFYESGKFFVYTGFKVKSVIVSVVSSSPGTEIEVDHSSFDSDGFYVLYRKAVVPSVIKLSYQAQ